MSERTARIGPGLLQWLGQGVGTLLILLVVVSMLLDDDIGLFALILVPGLLYLAWAFLQDVVVDHDRICHRRFFAARCFGVDQVEVLIVPSDGMLGASMLAVCEPSGAIVRLSGTQRWRRDALETWCEGAGIDVGEKGRPS